MAQAKPPGHFAPPRNTDPAVSHHVRRSAGQKTPSPRNAEVRTVVPSGHSQRVGQASRTSSEGTAGLPATSTLHGRQSPSWLNGADQDKAFLLALGQHIEHPMHPVVEINIRRAGAVSPHEFPGRWTGEGVTGRITDRRIGLALDHHPAARTPDQFATDQHSRALDRRLGEKFPWNHSGTGWSTNCHGTRNFFARCAASARTPKVSVA